MINAGGHHPQLTSVPVPAGAWSSFTPSFPLPNGGPMGGPPPFPGVERFITSARGGVIVDKDGAPAGRVPAGSFLDRTTGKVYGPDSKPLEVPAGSSVDFFDLPDVHLLTSVSGGGAGAPPKGVMPATPGTHGILGQWGPGGITPIKGGGAGAGCDMDHGVPVGPMSTVAGGPPPAALQQMHMQLQQLLAGMGAVPGGHGSMMPPGLYPPRLPVGFSPAVHGGGLGTGVLGATGVGTVPSLQSALMELVATLNQLAQAVQASAMGGGPKPATPAAPTSAAPAPAEAEPAKTEPPKTEPAKTEPAKTEPAKPAPAPTSSSSSADTTSTTSTAAPSQPPA